MRYFLAVDRVDRPLLRGQAHQDLPQRLAPGRHAVRTAVRELGAPFSGVDAQLQTRPLFRDERVRKRRPRRDLKGPHVAGRRRLGQPLRPEPPVRLGDEFAQTEPAAPAVDVVDPPRENPPVAVPGRDHRHGQSLVEVVAALLPDLPRAGLPGRGVVHHEKALDDVGMPLPREDTRTVPARVLRVVGDRPSPEAVAPPEAHVVGEAERAVRAVVDGGVLRGGEEDARLLEAQTVRRRGVGAALRHGGREVGHAENPFRTAVRGAPRSHRGPRRLRPRHGPHGVEAVGEMVLPLPAERRPRAVRLPRRGERERGMLEPLRQVRGGEVREVMRPPPRTRLVVAAVVEVEDVEAPTVEPTDDIPHPGVMVVRRPVLDWARDGARGGRPVIRLHEVRRRAETERRRPHARRERRRDGLLRPGRRVPRELLVEKARERQLPMRAVVVEAHLLLAEVARDGRERDADAGGRTGQLRLQDGTGPVRAAERQVVPHAPVVGESSRLAHVQFHAAGHGPQAFVLPYVREIDAQRRLEAAVRDGRARRREPLHTQRAARRDGRRQRRRAPGRQPHPVELRALRRRHRVREDDRAVGPLRPPRGLLVCEVVFGADAHGEPARVYHRPHRHHAQQKKSRTHPTLRFSPCRRTRASTTDRLTFSDLKTAPSYAFRPPPSTSGVEKSPPGRPVRLDINAVIRPHLIPPLPRKMQLIRPILSLLGSCLIFLLLLNRPAGLPASV